MKKVLLTLAFATVFAIGMSACCGNKCETTAAENETECTTAATNEHECTHECTCADTTCKANNCENCETLGNGQCCKKADKACCKEGDKACCKEGDKACCKEGDKACCKEGDKACCKKDAQPAK